MPEEVETPEKAKVERRRIPGNLPYTASPGGLRRGLDKAITSEKPPVFNTDFVNSVLQVPGGSGRPLPSILKAVGMLDASAVPTELYSQFQTEAGRPNAALQALRNGFGEIFRRNQTAHRADERGLIDLIVATTGLPRADPIVRNILTTFQAFQHYARGASDEFVSNGESVDRQSSGGAPPPTEPISPMKGGLGLIYNINVVLPETTNPEVYNAIFRSLKANLLP